MLYRVYDLPEGLRTKLKAKGAKASATTSQIVQAATEESLPKIVVALTETGFAFDGEPTRPARIPMTDVCAKKLKTASEETGISVSPPTACLHCSQLRWKRRMKSLDSGLEAVFRELTNGLTRVGDCRRGFSCIYEASPPGLWSIGCQRPRRSGPLRWDEAQLP